MRSIFAAFVALAFTSVAHAESPRAQTIHPAMFVVRDADSTIYLFGTVHIRRPGAAWGGPEAMAALAASQDVWTELEMSPAADARAAGEIAPIAMSDTPLSSLLTEAQRARIAEAAAKVSVPVSYLEHMRPWFAGLMLSMLPIMRAGYDTNAGVDRQIDAYADAHNLRSRWFETSGEQFEFFTNMSQELQIAMLMEGADAAIEGIAEMGDMERAWETGDTRTLERLVIDQTRDQYPELYQVLFVARNRAWTETLAAEMAGAGTDFVAVGAGHLLGRDGLVHMLRDRGFHVERVRPQAAE